MWLPQSCQGPACSSSPKRRPTYCTTSSHLAWECGRSMLGSSHMTRTAQLIFYMDLGVFLDTHRGGTPKKLVYRKQNRANPRREVGTTRRAGGSSLRGGRHLVLIFPPAPAVMGAGCHCLSHYQENLQVICIDTKSLLFLAAKDTSPDVINTLK